MRRGLLMGGWLIAAASLWPPDSSAQERKPPAIPPGLYNGLTPGSTAPGDALRLGELSALQAAMGTPYFFMSRPLADAIDAATTMTWNEYYQTVFDMQNRQYRAKRAQRLRLYNERQQRILDDPGEADLMLGDAPNALLMLLSNPRIHPSELRRYGEAIPGETIQRISFHFGTGESPISLGRLTLRDGWPLPLRGADFEKERRDYQEAIETALDQNRRGKLTPGALRALQQAVEALHRKLLAVNPEMKREDFALARSFLDNLRDAVEPLRQPVVEKVLAGIDSYSGTTVGDLVIFMQRYNLRFAPAMTPEERESYHTLYASMLRLRDVVGPPPGSPRRNADIEGPAPGGAPIRVEPGRDATPGNGAPSPGRPADRKPASEEGARSGPR